MMTMTKISLRKACYTYRHAHLKNACAILAPVLHHLCSATEMIASKPHPFLRSTVTAVTSSVLPLTFVQVENTISNQRVFP